MLEQVGIEFRDTPEALALFRDAGADVDGERVRFPRGLRRQIVQALGAARASRSIARNPAHNVEIGGPHTVFAPAYGSPFVRDLDDGRRYGTIEDFRNFVKLTYMTPFLHHSGGTVCEPVDLPVNKRHYDMVYAHMRYSRQAVHGLGHASGSARRTRSRWRGSCFGGDFLERPHRDRLSLINANSPLVWDATMLGAAKAYAEANQAVLITPFILAGAMSPATVAGVATQTLAEALAGMAFCQLVRPGAPVIFGSFASSMSMQSGAPTFGTPEPALVLYAMAALARRLGVPFRSGGVAHRVEARRTRRPRTSRRTRCSRRCSAASTSCSTRRAGSRAGSRWATRSSSSTSTRRHDGTRSPRAWTCRRTARRSTRCSTNAPGIHFLGHRAHARELRDRVLALVERRQRQLRAVERRGRDGRERARERDLEEDARRVRGSADRRRHRRGAARVHRPQEGLLPGRERADGRLDASSAAVPTIAELIARSRYEVIPLAGAEEQVLEHVPTDVTLTSPSRR